jgi:hypothetical protein
VTAPIRAEVIAERTYGGRHTARILCPFCSRTHLHLMPARPGHRPRRALRTGQLHDRRPVVTEVVVSVAEELVRNGSRGSGRGLPWKARTHCEHGHEFTPENTMPRVDSSGRRCRQCQRERGRRWYQQKGAALRAARRHGTTSATRAAKKGTP